VYRRRCTIDRPEFGLKKARLPSGPVRRQPNFALGRKGDAVDTANKRGFVVPTIDLYPNSEAADGLPHSEARKHVHPLIDSDTAKLAYAFLVGS